MRKPKMILFDYGQTLISESYFDGVKGTAAVMQYAAKNKYGKTPEQIQSEAEHINRELGRFEASKRHLFQIEIPFCQFEAYLFQTNGIALSIPYSEAEHIFWDAAAPGAATQGIEEFLDFLKNEGIRTGVISNISYSQKTLAERINKILPDNQFEFIIASSEYVFRKPNQRIFHLALEMAELKPEETWYIGDQYECDIVGAKNAGLFPVWYTSAVDFKQDMEEDAFKISSWSELKDYLLQLPD